jgi:hypothetical protein
MGSTEEAAREYRKRAAILREKAALMNIPDNRSVMLSAASGYEYLAQMIEEAAVDGGPLKNSEVWKGRR